MERTWLNLQSKIGIELGTLELNMRMIQRACSPSASQVPTVLVRYQTLMMPGTRALWIIRIFNSRVHSSIRIFDHGLSQVSPFTIYFVSFFCWKKFEMLNNCGFWNFISFARNLSTTLSLWLGLIYYAC